MKTPRTGAGVLTINGGSSSIKLALFEARDARRRIWAGRIEGIGSPQGSFPVKGTNPARRPPWGIAWCMAARITGNRNASRR